MSDLFVSYRHADRDALLVVVARLREAGLDVWLDDTDIEDFGSIQGAIERGLAGSKALLAWYSARYPESLACQWELTRAFTLAQQEGDPRRRILLINPEPSNTHVHPIELRDALYRRAPDDAAGLETTCVAIVAHVRKLAGTFSSVQPAAKPRWFGGAAGSGSNRFFGRLPELWQIHSALWSADVPIIEGGEKRPLVRLTGIGGSGKSLTAETYALRFGAAYAGGVFWLRAFGNDAARPICEAGAEERAAARTGQLIALAQALGVETQGMKPDQLRGKLRERLECAGSYLWVVDDLASDAAMGDVALWAAPSANGRTLITTRGEALGWLGTQVRMDDLDDAAAFDLLTHARRPAGSGDVDTARAIVRDLGNHALALELAAVAVQKRGFAEFHASLNLKSRDVMDFAADLLAIGERALPHRERANLNLSTTLLLSVQELDGTARDFLRLAAELAPVPIDRKLVASTFVATDGIDPSAGDDAADLAMIAVAGRSLAREPVPGRLLVHTLVSRAVRFRDDDAARRQGLRGGALIAIDEILCKDVYDDRRHREIRDVIDHARALVAGRAPSNDDEGRVLDTFYAYEFGRGHYGEARAIAEALIEYGRRTAGAEHSSTLQMESYLGRVRRAEGDPAGSLAIHERVYDACRRTLGELHRQTLWSLSDMAVAFAELGDLARARRLQEEVLKKRRWTLGDEHADTVAAISNLAATLSVQGEASAARQLQERVLDLHKESVGWDHSESLEAAVHYAETLRSLGDLAGARSLQEKVLEARTRLLGEEHPDTLMVLNNLAVTIHAQGDARRAREMIERVLELRSRILGKEHPLTLATVTNLAALCMFAADFPAALTLLEDSLERHRRSLGREHPETLKAAYHLAVSLVESNDSSGRVRELMTTDLAPLIACDPDSLSEDLRQVRGRILPILTSASGRQKQQRKPWWKRLF